MLSPLLLASNRYASESVLISAQKLEKLRLRNSAKQLVLIQIYTAHGTLDADRFLEKIGHCVASRILVYSLTNLIHRYYGVNGQIEPASFNNTTSQERKKTRL